MGKHYGKVYLLGAGPGDVGLLTLKAYEILLKADVVVYDRLVGADILKLIPDSAEKINAGKNAGNHPVSQEEINRILFEKASCYQTVVRLKGGDPFLFGRGGEELELLCQNGVEFEVVPGVTSAVSAAAYAGIPVTHRDYCSSLHIITGHGRQNGVVTIDYDALVKLNGTLVFMMSVATLPLIVKGLSSAGMASDTKAAVVENGTRPNQRKFIGDLATIEQIVTENNVKPPSVIIIGNVCELSGQFDWFGKKALKNIRIALPVAVYEEGYKPGELKKSLSELGADVIEYPCVSYTINERDIDISTDNWLIFTHPVSVRGFFKNFKYDARALAGKKIACKGVQTGDALLNYGLKADFTASVANELTLARELVDCGHVKPFDTVRIFLDSNDSIDEFEPFFAPAQVKYTGTDIFESVFNNSLEVNIQDFDIAVFPTLSGIRGFARASGENKLKGVDAVCIGEKTADCAKSYAMNAYVPDTRSINSMVELIINKYGRQL